MKLGAWIQFNSRSQSFLWKMSIGILLVGFAIAAVWEQVSPPAMDPTAELTEQVFDFEFDPSRPVPTGPMDFVKGQADVGAVIEPWLRAHGRDLPLAIRTMTRFGGWAELLDPEYDLEAAIRENVADTPGRRILIEHLRSRRAGEPTALLKEFAARKPAMRGANLAVATVLNGVGKHLEAGASYELEGAIPEAHQSRIEVMKLYIRLGEFREVDRLRKDPAYTNILLASTEYGRAIDDRDWWGILRWEWLARYDDWIKPPNILLGVLSGLFWFAFMVYAGGVRKLSNGRLWLCAAGVLMGVLSVWITLFAYTWLELALDFTMGPAPTLRHGLIYCIAGIGLTEEICKLLFVLPLVPILLKRGYAIEMVIVSACVGLGFAAEENIGYYEKSMGGATAGRFLTANFFHMAATGMTGFALCQMIHKPRERAMDFVVIFLGVVIAHGIYDALLMIPSLEDYSYFYGTVFVLIAYQFFRELRLYMPRRQRTVGLTCVFLAGFVTLIAAAYIAATRQVGLMPALDVMVPSTLAAAVIIVLYVREINEPLHP